MVICGTAVSNAQKGAITQTTTDDDAPIVIEKQHAFFAGLKGGAVFSSMTQPEQCDLYDKSGIGFSAAAVFKARFGKSSDYSDPGTGLMGVAAELMYKQNSVKTVGTDEKGKTNADMSLSYVEVPVYAQIYPFYKTPTMNTLHLDAGIDIAGTISKNPKTLTVSGLTGAYSSVVYNVEKLKGFDVRFLIGVGYDFKIKNAKNETSSLVGINARYYAGTSELAKTFKSKMNSFEISLSWMFYLGAL